MKFLGQIGRIAWLLPLILLAVPCLAQQTAKTYRIPFRTFNGLILLDVKVNDKPAVVLLDTGAQTTIISPKLADVRSRDSRTFATIVQGVRARAKLVLSADLNYSGDFYVMDFAETSKQAGVQIDGLLGENILRDFSAVRIDYKHSVLELEAK